MTQANEWETAIRANDVRKLAQWCERSSAEIKATTRVLTSGAAALQGSDLPADSLNLMHVAALYDALDCFVYLHTVWARSFAQGSPLAVRNAVQALPLHYACYAGATEVATYILAQEPAQARDLPDTVRKHLLALTSMSKDAAIMQLLLDNGADLGQRKNSDNDPLGTAISNNAADCALLLDSRGGRPEDKRDCPLTLAINRNQLELALTFCRRAGADLQFKSADGRFALRLAVSQLGRPDKRPWFQVVKEIAERGGRVDVDPADNCHGVVHAALTACVPLDVLEYLLGLPGVNVNHNDVSGDSCACALASLRETPLQNSPAASYHTSALELLFAKGFAQANAPRLLLRFLLGPVTPVNAIRWLLQYCTDHGEPLRPDDVPIPAQAPGVAGQQSGVKTSLKAAFEKAIKPRSSSKQGKALIEIRDAFWKQ
jgi:ankyrin repeat protein